MCVNLDRFPHGCTSCRNLVPQHQAPKKRSLEDFGRWCYERKLPLWWFQICLVFHWDDPVAIETEETPQAREQREQWLGSTTVWILGNFWGTFGFGIWYYLIDLIDLIGDLNSKIVNERLMGRPGRDFHTSSPLPDMLTALKVWKRKLQNLYPTDISISVSWWNWCLVLSNYINFIIFQCSTGWSQGLPHVSGLKKALGSHFFHHRILADPEAWIFWVPPKSGYPVTLWYFNSLRTGQWP